MRLLLTVIGLLIVQVSHAQLVQVAIPHSPEKPARTNSHARTKAVLNLPFWDDFSKGTTRIPSADNWATGQSVWVNNSMGINPPSISVATFDGIDSLGKPYSVTDVLAKGFADNLESQPIDLTLVPAVERNSVFISFYYQLKGRGELPDAGDKLILEFRKDNDNWEEVWFAENDGLIRIDTFMQVVLPIADPTYYHAGFQFRFKNFARLSGPYDTWNLDYIYINKGRTATDTSYPDRTIVSPMTSMFNTYHAISKSHFFVDKEGEMVRPTIVLHNLKVNNNQPVNYYSYAQIDEYDDGIMTPLPETPLDADASLGAGGINSLEFVTAEIQLQGLADLLDESVDSLLIRLKLGMSTDDNVLPDPDHGITGDYELKYAPMDFRLNDTTRAQFWLSSFYAYDDGSAEYGAALNQPGSQVAYKFKIVGENGGFINYMDMYFPRFGDETRQVIELTIWNDLDGTESSELYSELVELQRNQDNVFWRKKLTESVEVENIFYIGWKQSSSAVIAVGLDKNTESGDKVFYNLTGAWEPNLQLSGSLMMRPVFGENLNNPHPDDTVGVVDDDLEAGLAPWPNPTSGSFVVPGQVRDISVRDISGRHVPTMIMETPYESTVTFPDPRPGIYIVQYVRDGYPRRSRIMVR